MRVGRLLDTYANSDEEMQEEIRKGQKRQSWAWWNNLSHYKRKEELMFPIMESYGHDSPPKCGVWTTKSVNYLKKWKQRSRAVACFRHWRGRRKVSDYLEFEAMILSEERIYHDSVGIFCITDDIWNCGRKWFMVMQSFSRQRSDSASSSFILEKETANFLLRWQAKC